MKEYSIEMPFNKLTIIELRDAFFSLKANKSAGHDEVNFNAIKGCFEELCEPLLFLFNLSLHKGTFPDKLKIAKVTPIYKTGEKTELGNYRPISVLPCFSKILVRSMQSRVMHFFTEQNILYNKQFGFQPGQSTDHALVELIDQIYNSFNSDDYTIGVFIDLSKAQFHQRGYGFQSKIESFLNHHCPLHTAFS